MALVVPAGRLRAARALVAVSGWRKVRVSALPAGTPSTPSAELSAGLAALQSGAAVIVVQEGARPLLASGMLAEAIRRASEQSVIGAATPVTETIKWADAAGLVRLTPPRASLWQLQTPLVVPRWALEAALTPSATPALAADAPASVLDWLLRWWGEAGAGPSVEHQARLAVRLVRADSSDLLVRRHADLAVAAALVQARALAPRR
jgi:hypothetical protein